MNLFIAILLFIPLILPNIVFGKEDITHFIIEAYPDSIQASLEAHERQIADTSSNVTAAPYYLIVPITRRWKPGQVIRVAFNGGNDDLYKKIEQAATEWTKPNAANLTLKFKDKNGRYNTWSPRDTNYKAEIRVAFLSGPSGGYWSLVGNNSRNDNIKGGSPYEASLNLGNFDKKLPPNWKAIVMHEFGHAIGFEHEHQNPTEGCDFRFDDDPGYVLTKDANGWFTSDRNGLRPGLYTYLGGKANYWPKWKVDFNLKALQNTRAYLIGNFDKNSIMKYFFDEFMFQKGANSACYTKTENIILTESDKQGAHEAYSSDPNRINSAVSQQKAVYKQILAAPNSPLFIKKQIDLLQLQLE